MPFSAQKLVIRIAGRRLPLLWLLSRNPKDAKKPKVIEPPNWIPITLRTSTLSVLVAFPLTLVAVFEYLSVMTQRNGGMVFAEQQFSNLTSFTYLYLPTILAVIYSMMWAWIDLDAKRLEPYFQMSRRGGASASDSISLHYPFEFVLIQPIEAFRRKYAACLLPLLPALPLLTVVSDIGLSSFRPRISVDLLWHYTVDRCSVRDAQGQPNIFRQRYSDSNSLAPFEMQQHPQQGLPNSTWTTQTLMYSSELDCKPAKYKNDSGQVTYDDGNGCVIPNQLLSFYISDRNGMLASYLQTPCTNANGSEIYLAFFMKNSEPVEGMIKNLTGITGANFTDQIADVLSNWALLWDTNVLFCRPSYYVQSVSASVTIPNMSVSDIRPLELAQPLSRETFNITNFEALLVTDSSDRVLRTDINETTRNIDTTQLDRKGITDLRSHVIIFAVGVLDLEPEAYLNATVFATSLDKAYRLLFALAVNSLLLDNNSTLTSFPGVIQGETNAVVVVRTLAIVLEVSLSMTAFLTLLLLFVCRNRPKNCSKILRH